MHMKLIFGVSFATLLFISSLFAFASDSEIERLQTEVAEAQNAMDAELLKPGAKPTDPKVKEKAEVLDRKTKELREAFQKRVARPKGSQPKTETVSRPSESTDSERESPTMPDPGPTLSGENVQKEITYGKKGSRPANNESPQPSPDPSSSRGELGSGISEIQYSKKPSSRPKESE